MYKLLLCLRYLRTRYIALACVVSVMLGVATMIVVNSVMAGFGTEMRDRIHGLLADVILETVSIDGRPDPEKHMQIVRQVLGDDVSGMTATVEVYGMLSFQYAGQWITRPITLIGVRPEEKATVGPLVNYLDSYNAIKEDDRIVRAALRAEDVPPGWQLTDEAREYRARWIARQDWMREQMAREHDPPSEPAVPHGAPGGGREFDPTRLFDDAPAGSQPPAADAASKPVAVADGGPDAAAPAAAAGDAADPFLRNPAVRAADAGDPLTPEERTAPLPGRLYVGSGLVTFPYEDEDRKVRTMKMVQPGDDVKISTITSGRPPNPVHFNATVVDVLKTGMSEYDSNLVFCNLEYLQQVRGMVDPESGKTSITSIQIRLKDYSRADEVVKKLRAAFPPGVYSVRTWEQKQGPLLAAVDVESAILNVLLFLIIAVAGFGILAIFFMIVVEKTRDIGILKALGASSRGVMSIFLGYGLTLGIVGSGVGVGLGLLFVVNINRIEKVLTWMTGRKVFDETIYYFPEIPTSVSPAMVLWVAVGAMAIAVLASILPARRAARLHPVEALRFDQ